MQTRGKMNDREEKDKQNKKKLEDYVNKTKKVLNISISSIKVEIIEDLTGYVIRKIGDRKSL